MADKTLDALTAAAALGTADLFYCMQGGNSRKATGSQIQTLCSTSDQSTSLSQISSSLSSEISSRISGDSSLSTVISGSISTVNSSITSLSTAVSTVDANQSTSISINLSKINSLSTALGGGGMTLISTASPTGTAVVTFSSIPNTYTNLCIMFSGRSAGAVTIDNLNLTINNDGNSVYDTQVTNGSGTTVTAANQRGTTSALVGFIAGSSATANMAGSGVIYFNNYNDTNLNKVGTFSTDAHNSTAAGGANNRNGGFQYRPATPAAITRIDLTAQTGNFVAGTTISLYGIP